MKVHELITLLQQQNLNNDVIVWSEELEDNHDVISVDEDTVNRVETILSV